MKINVGACLEKLFLRTMHCYVQMSGAMNRCLRNLLGDYSVSYVGGEASYAASPHTFFGSTDQPTECALNTRKVSFLHTTFEPEKAVTLFLHI